MAKRSEGSGKTSDGDDAGDASLSSSEDSADERRLIIRSKNPPLKKSLEISLDMCVRNM